MICIERNYLEFKCGCPVKIPPIDILRNSLFHNTALLEGREQGYYRQAKHSDYIVKIYDKGQQYNIKQNTLRYELKYIRARKINQLGIYTLSDLDSSKWKRQALNELLNNWDNYYFFDPSIHYNEQNIKLNQWSNPYYWQTLKGMRRKREKEQYKQFELTESKRIHEYLRYCIADTWESLFT